MKKILSVLLILLSVMLFLGSCQGKNVAGDLQTEHTHTFLDATCQAPKTCSCGATEGEVRSTHRFENAVCADCGKLLVQELGESVIDPKTGDPLDGFAVIRKEYGSEEIVAVSVSYMADPYSGNHAERALTEVGINLEITQEGILSGEYHWELRRKVFDNYMCLREQSNLSGVICAAEFSASAYEGLSVTENDGFPDHEAAVYLVKAHEMMDALMGKFFYPALETGGRGLEAERFGFPSVAK